MHLLLVTHRPVEGTGGSVARWRALAPRLRAAGWEIDVVSARVGVASREYSAEDARRVQRRARRVELIQALAAPVFFAAGVTSAAVPISTAWLRTATDEVRERLAARAYDVALATGPPMVGLLALASGARGSAVPLVDELRDLWAGNPAYDRRGGLLRHVEARVLAGAAAVVVTTLEARDDLARRHPQLADRIVEIPNGFEPGLLGLRERAVAAAGGVTTILHSGTLLRSRPLRPLLDALAGPARRGRFRLVLHGYLSPTSVREVADAHPAVEVEVVPPSPWEDAIERIRAADVCLVTQSRAAGDVTAVAAKVYEYLALGKPVLCLTDGGATERLLRGLDAAELCARLDDPQAIGRALDRAAAEQPDPLPPERLAPYRRDAHAAAMNELLGSVASARVADAGVVRR